METEIIQTVNSTFFDTSTLPVYLLGFITFIATILDDWTNDKKTFKKFSWYFQEFLYTILSIAMGISTCFILETSTSVSWIVSIIMGLTGSTIIRKIRFAGSDIADTIISKILDKIRNK